MHADGWIDGYGAPGNRLYINRGIGFCSAPPERLRTEAGRLAAFPEASARAWADALPNARLLVLPEADHYPHVDQPQAFFSAAERFLDGTWPAGSQPGR